LIEACVFPQREGPSQWCPPPHRLQRQRRARFTRRWREGKTHAAMHPHRCRRAHSGRGYPRGLPRRPRPGWRRDRRHRLLRCRACPLLAGRGDKGLVGGSSRSAVNLVLGSKPRSVIALQPLLDWCSRTCASQPVAGAGKRSIPLVDSLRSGYQSRILSARQQCGALFHYGMGRRGMVHTLQLWLRRSTHQHRCQSSCVLEQDALVVERVILVT
jgi:hypothetical protein